MRTSRTLVIRYCGLLLAVGIGAIGYAMGCGSSGTATTGSTGSTVSITGTVQAPTSANVAVPFGKSLGLKTVSDAAASDRTCTVYTIDGEKLGTATSGTDGTFTVEADLATLRPADATPGGTWSVPLVATGVNSDGSQEVDSYAELTVVEGTTTTVSLGTLNTDSTLSTAAVLKKLGCDPRKEKACTPPAGVDLACLFEAEQAIWDLADVSGAGSADDAGKIETCVQAAQAAGVTPADLGTENWGDAVLALRDGTIGASGLSAIATACASTVGTDAGTLQTQLTSAATKMEAVRKSITDVFAGGAGLDAVTTTKGAASSDSSCASVKGSDDFAKAMVQGMLAEDDATKILKTYGSATAWDFIAGVMDQETDGNLSEFLGDGAAIDAYLEKFGGSYDSLLSGGKLDIAAVTGCFTIIKTQIDSATMTADKMGDVMVGWFNQIDVSGGWSAFCPAGTCDAGKIDYVETNFEVGTFDPDTATLTTYQKIDGFVDNANSGSTQFADCQSKSTPELQKTCFDAMSGGSGTTNTTKLTAGTYTRSGAASCVGAGSAAASIVIADATASDTPTTGSRLSGIGLGSNPISASSATVCSFTSCTGVGGTCAISGSSIVFTSCQFGLSASDRCTATYTRP